MISRKKIQLQAGEEIMDHFRPNKSFRLKQNEWHKIPFSIFWSLFCIYLLLPNFDNSLFFKIWSIPFYLGMFYLLILRFVLIWIEINYSEYYITNQRLIFKNNFFNKTSSISYNKFTISSLNKYNHRIGYIIIGEPRSWLKMGDPYFIQEKYIFENVEHATEKYHLIQQMKKESGTQLEKKSYAEIYSDICMESQIHLEKQLDRFLSLAENNAIRNAGSLIMLESFSNSIMNTENAQEAKIVLDDLLKVKRLEPYLKQFNAFLKEENLIDEQFSNEIILNKGNCLDIMNLSKYIEEKEPDNRHFAKIIRRFNYNLRKKK